MAQIHRFRAAVAGYLGKGGETVYMTPEQAEAIGAALIACARDIREQPSFAKSSFRTQEFTITNPNDAARD